MKKYILNDFIVETMEIDLKNKAFKNKQILQILIKKEGEELSVAHNIIKDIIDYCKRNREIDGLFIEIDTNSIFLRTCIENYFSLFPSDSKKIKLYKVLK
jgi:hypothetical protein